MEPQADNNKHLIVIKGLPILNALYIVQYIADATSGILQFDL